MRHVLRAAAFVAFLCVALSVTADASPPANGTYYGVADTLNPVGSRHTISVMSRTDGSGTMLTVVYPCGAAAPCSQSKPAREVIRGVMLAPGFDATAPKPVLLMVASATACTARFGPEAWAVLWSDTGGPPYTAECLSRSAAPITGGSGTPGTPHPMPIPQIRIPRIPPYVERPVIPPTPNPGPIPPH